MHRSTVKPYLPPFIFPLKHGKDQTPWSNRPSNCQTIVPNFFCYGIFLLKIKQTYYMSMAFCIRLWELDRTSAFEGASGSHNRCLVDLTSRTPPINNVVGRTDFPLIFPVISDGFFFALYSGPIHKISLVWALFIIYIYVVVNFLSQVNFFFQCFWVW